MLTNHDIRKLSDYVLLNAYSVNSTSLYNGKAGMSLSLFEVARYLNDESIEEHAFELLQESLLSKNDDIGFEYGLSGIGYVLQYLIENEFIDADFDEFFGEQTGKILTGLEKSKQNPSNLLDSIRIVQFLAQVNKKRSDPVMARHIKMLFEAVELYLSIQFFDFTSRHYRGDKMAVLSVFGDYLRLVDFSGYSDFSPSLLDAYASLFRKGRIASSYALGFYLEKISTGASLPDYADVIQNNKQYALANLKPDLLLLRERLDLLKLMQQDTTLGSADKIKLEKGLLDARGKELEQNILRLIPAKTYIPGYGFGIARFLRYCVNNVC